MDDVFIHELELPMCVHATTIPDEDGNFTIIVNSNLCAKAKKTAIEHEMVHIRHDHFYRELNVASDEQEAHGEEGSHTAKQYIKHIRIT